MINKTILYKNESFITENNEVLRLKEINENGVIFFNENSKSLVEFSNINECLLNFNTNNVKSQYQKQNSFNISESITDVFYKKGKFDSVDKVVEFINESYPNDKINYNNINYRTKIILNEIYESYNLDESHNNPILENNLELFLVNENIVEISENKEVASYPQAPYVSDKDLKELVYNELDETSIHLLYAWISGNTTTEYKDDDYRFIVFNHIKNNRKGDIANFIFNRHKEFFADNKKLHECFNVSDIERIYESKGHLLCKDKNDNVRFVITDGKNHQVSGPVKIFESRTGEFNNEEFLAIIEYGYYSDQLNGIVLDNGNLVKKEDGKFSIETKDGKIEGYETIEELLKVINS